MGEGEEDKSLLSKESSKGSISHAGPSRHTPKPQSNESSQQQGPRRTRPGRAQRQRRRDAAENSAPTASPSNLNPSAPDFVPSQVLTPVAQAANPTANANRNRPRGGRRGRPRKETENAPASTATEEPSHEPPVGSPQRMRKNDNVNFRAQHKIIKESEDLMLRMTEALSKGEYDCSICTDLVSPFGNVTRLQKVQRWKPVWSCKICWTVFHRSCIKKWASHSLGEGPVWRCPGCQNPSDTVPNEYRCWCGKMENPDVDRLATPHSCTQPCLRKRKSGCACVLPCHPGITSP
jgi:transcriptional repressor NF-X1